MADMVRMCPSCGTECPLTRGVCSCGESLENVRPTPRPGAASAEAGREAVPGDDVHVETAEGNEAARPESALLEATDGSARFVLENPSELGRGWSVDLTPFPGCLAISRKHARITRNAGRWYIEDLKSTNGTFVNGMKVFAGALVEISQGDILALGNVTFRFTAA
jgi:hypothetical protein